MEEQQSTTNLNQNKNKNNQMQQHQVPNTNATTGSQGNMGAGGGTGSAKSNVSASAKNNNEYGEANPQQLSTNQVQSAPVNNSSVTLPQTSSASQINLTQQQHLQQQQQYYQFQQQQQLYMGNGQQPGLQSAVTGAVSSSNNAQNTTTHQQQQQYYSYMPQGNNAIGIQGFSSTAPNIHNQHAIYLQQQQQPYYILPPGQQPQQLPAPHIRHGSQKDNPPILNNSISDPQGLLLRHQLGATSDHHLSSYVINSGMIGPSSIGSGGILPGVGSFIQGNILGTEDHSMKDPVIQREPGGEEEDINIDLGKGLLAQNQIENDQDQNRYLQAQDEEVLMGTGPPDIYDKINSDQQQLVMAARAARQSSGNGLIIPTQLQGNSNVALGGSIYGDDIVSKLKDLEYDNFRLDRKLQETLSRQWRIESLFNNYVFSSVVREKYESSNYYNKGAADSQYGVTGGNNNCYQENSGPSSLNAKTYYVHFVDYLSVNAFKRIQDAIDVAKDFDKIVVHAGVYNESIVINKQLTLISNGYVELRSNSNNIITCCALNEGCLIKGFSIRRLDGSKVDPISCGLSAVVGADKSGGGTQVSLNDMRDTRSKDGRDRSTGGGDRDRERPSDRDRGDRDDDSSIRGGQAGRQFSSENKFCIYVKEGRVTIEECDMMSECGTVVFCNPRSQTKLIRNRVCGSIGSGVMVTGKGARLLAEDNHIYGATGCGVDVRNNSSCTLIKNKIHNCDKSGVYILMTNEAKIYRNEIWENHFSGIEVTNAQRVEIINNRIYQNKRAGLYFHTESVIFAENNEIVENKNANVIMKEKSRVTMVHNYIAKSVGSGLVILTGSGCKFESNIIRGCLNNGIDLCNGDIYAKNNIITDNERSGLYGNGHIKGCFQMNKIIGNKSQAWNNGLCKYIMDQDNKGGYNSISKIEGNIFSNNNTHDLNFPSIGLSKERFVMYRNIDDCELKNQDILIRQQGYSTQNIDMSKLSEADKEQRRYDMKIQQILKDLEELEKNFFIPVNAHPLKKVNELRPAPDDNLVGINQTADRNLRTLDDEPQAHATQSSHYKQWQINQGGAAASKKQAYNSSQTYDNVSETSERNGTGSSNTAVFGNSNRYNSKQTSGGRYQSPTNKRYEKANAGSGPNGGGGRYSRNRNNSNTRDYEKINASGSSGAVGVGNGAEKNKSSQYQRRQSRSRSRSLSRKVGSAQEAKSSRLSKDRKKCESPTKKAQSQVNMQTSQTQPQNNTFSSNQNKLQQQNQSKEDQWWPSTNAWKNQDQKNIAKQNQNDRNNNEIGHGQSEESSLWTNNQQKQTDQPQVDKQRVEEKKNGQQKQQQQNIYQESQNSLDVLMESNNENQNDSQNTFTILQLDSANESSNQQSLFHQPNTQQSQLSTQIPANSQKDSAAGSQSTQSTDSRAKQPVASTLQSSGVGKGASDKDMQKQKAQGNKVPTPPQQIGISIGNPSATKTLVNKKIFEVLHEQPASVDTANTKKKGSVSKNAQTQQK